MKNACLKEGNSHCKNHPNIDPFDVGGCQDWVWNPDETAIHERHENVLKTSCELTRLPEQAEQWDSLQQLDLGSRQQTRLQRGCKSTF